MFHVHKEAQYKAFWGGRTVVEVMPVIYKNPIKVSLSVTLTGVPVKGRKTITFRRLTNPLTIQSL